MQKKKDLKARGYQESYAYEKGKCRNKQIPFQYSLLIENIVLGETIEITYEFDSYFTKIYLNKY